MEADERKIKINAMEFLHDFVSGMSNNDLAQKYRVSPSQLGRLIAALQDKGLLGSEHISQREECAAGASGEVRVEDTPFAVVRGRSLLLCGLGAGLAGFFYGAIISLAFGGSQSSPVTFLAGAMVFYLFFILLVRTRLLRAKLKPGVMFGVRPPWPTVGRYILLTFPLFLSAIVATYLLYLPVSYLAPHFVQWLLLDSDLMDFTSGSPLASVLGFLVVVLIGPVFEEFLFRGLLLTRWSLKWNVRRGIFLSSLVFALGHTDIVGAFFFGYVLCVVYIETKSLFVPICLHMANNAIVWIVSVGSTLISNSDAPMTLTEWQSYWWIGLLAAGIIMPWAIWFTKRHFPTAQWRVPYVSLRESLPDAQGYLKSA